MKNLKFLFAGALTVMLLSCNDKDKKNQNENMSVAKTPTSTTPDKTKTAAEYDPQRGLGKYTHQDVELGPIDATMVKKGEKLAEVKCFTCHKPSEERLVGPGWKGVTSRHTGEWIMNFISNPDAMINVDPSLQEQLEICLVRMPNQGLNDEEARQILEYMRKIDSN